MNTKKKENTMYWTRRNEAYRKAVEGERQKERDSAQQIANLRWPARVIAAGKVARLGRRGYRQ